MDFRLYSGKSNNLGFPLVCTKVHNILLMLICLLYIEVNGYGYRYLFVNINEDILQ